MQTPGNAMRAAREVRKPGGNDQRSVVARDSSKPNRNSLCCENATVDISNKGIKRIHKKEKMEVRVKMSIVQRSALHASSGDG